MIGAQSPPDGARQDLGVEALVAIAAFGYLLVIGAQAWRDPSGASHVINALVGAAIAVLYIFRAARMADRMDRLLLAALLVFAVTCVFSEFLRQSLNALLVCALYVAGLFVLRGVLASEASRSLFMAALRCLSGLLTVAIAVQVIYPFLDWWALTGWTVIPPLDLRLQAPPWTSRYEAALLLVLLYPSWWTGRVTWQRAVVGAVVGAIVVATCLIVGSRTIWFAAAVGCIAVAVPTLRRTSGNRSLRIAAVGVLSVLLATVVLTPGIWATLGERVGRVASVVERAAVWASALAEWSERPLLGLGPSSFPWVLQLTGYFETHSYSPRQPDSAVVHLIVEAGLLGLGAAAIVLAAVVPSLVRARSRPALFAGVVWLVAGIGLNTAEPAFLVAAMIGWVAYTCPREDRLLGPTPARREAFVLATAVATGLVAVAVTAMTAATIAYAIARAHVHAGNLEQATAGLRIAATLDPGLALYQRQLGTAYMLQGDPELAVGPLRRATRVNPTDDLAWRTLGLAFARVDERTAASEAFERALTLQRSDPTNILLRAEAALIDAEDMLARDLLAESVQAWPLITAAPGWAEFHGGSSTSLLLDQAHERWHTGAPSPAPVAVQPLLLAVMSGADLDSLRPEHRRNTWPLRSAYVEVMRCRPGATAALEATPLPARRESTFWELEVRQRELAGVHAVDPIRAHRIMTQSPALSREEFDHLNPLRENGSRGSSHDTWGYGRLPIEWANPDSSLPSPEAGFARWHLDPAGAVREAGLADVLPGCLR